MAQTIVFKSPLVSTASGLEKLRRDALLSGAANNGGRFLFDLDSEMCWPSQAAPSNGNSIIDVAEVANGSIVFPGGTVSFAGNGFDFTSMSLASTNDAGVLVPASVLNDIWTTYSGVSQRYTIIAWVKLPSLANWNAAASILSIAGDKAFNAAASLVTLNQQSGGSLSARRQTASGTAESAQLSSADLTAISAYGNVCQVTIWRDGLNQGIRVKTATGERSALLAVGSNNTQNFSGNAFYFGRPNAFGGSLTGSPSTLTALSGFRVYRGYIENQARTGRAPLDVANLDWTLTTGRTVFS
jgi:hypothetical protein